MHSANTIFLKLNWESSVPELLFHIVELSRSVMNGFFKKTVCDCDSASFSILSASHVSAHAGKARPSARIEFCQHVNVPNQKRGDFMKRVCS